jgi:hypothetical protein
VLLIGGKSIAYRILSHCVMPYTTIYISYFPAFSGVYIFCTESLYEFVLLVMFATLSVCCMVLGLIVLMMYLYNNRMLVGWWWFAVKGYWVLWDNVYGDACCYSRCHGNVVETCWSLLNNIYECTCCYNICHCNDGKRFWALYMNVLL